MVPKDVEGGDGYDDGIDEVEEQEQEVDNNLALCC